ncbi:unnamed protein product [Rotaria sordida]|uniref:Uncharacterized protein n=1 Tax=Rotaria sordida TaxID=392033 RepID=A0A813WPN8_9BILA|nr:unnamed protein product [Rotaria sordida]CAF0869740.1 unnamed protein product [Rotaria sordida]CAF1020200.1 unnamed protein product [Rotaria sordida]CAF1021723.1 unnamed protein product [Rotaria sordida]CAF3894352.1 unnamed protein product [Rotaria sordida]
MVSRNGDLLSFVLGLTSGIIALISLILTCTGVALPSWYIGTTANNTDVISEANLFYACFASNVSQGSISKTLTCTSYNSYKCSTTSYKNTVLNVTAYISGCINPTNSSSTFLNEVGPIYQILIDDFYRLRNAAIFSIITILCILFSTIFAFLTAIILLNIYLVFLAPILACIGIIFGICCLAFAGSVLNYTGVAFALFVVGVLLEVIVTTLLSIVAGRLNQIEKIVENKDNKQIFTHRSGAPIYFQHVYKRRI